MRFLIGFLLFLFMSSIASAAELKHKPKKLYSSGSWALYTRPLFTASDGGVMIIDGPICTAQTGSDETLVFRAAYYLKGMLVIQIGSPKWEFRRRYGKLTIRAGDLAIKIPHVHYAESYAEVFLQAKNAQNAKNMLKAMAESEAKQIEVVDSRGRVIARVPSNGMKAVLNRAQSCSNKY